MQWDAIIIGAGPVGLAAAIACKRQGLRCLIIDRDCICAALNTYPRHMTFFSTAERLEIGGHPFPSVQHKPTRDEALAYYRQVALAEDLEFKLYEPVESWSGNRGNFQLTTNKHSYSCKHIILATGFFHKPVRLNIPGETSAKCSHYFTSGHRYAAQRLAIIGAANSAVIAALECWRMGAEVTLIHRGADFHAGVKYWLRPDIENRIREGSIRVHWNTEIHAIEAASLTLRGPEGEHRIANDHVLCLTGYRADFSWLQAQGLQLQADNAPLVDEQLQAIGHPGLYIAGCALCGNDNSQIFIENGRHHATSIAATIAHKIV